MKYFFLLTELIKWQLISNEYCKFSLKNISSTGRKVSNSRYRDAGTRPGLNFINVLQAAFTQADLKSIKIQSSCQCLFALLGSAPVKAFRRMLVKLTPDVNFTKVLSAAFTLVGPKSAKWHCWLDCLFLRIQDLRM